MKEENIRVNYKTIDIVEQRGLLEITRDLGRLLTEEEFDEIMMVYKKVTDRLLAEAGKQGMDIQEINEDLLRKYNLEYSYSLDTYTIPYKESKEVIDFLSLERDIVKDYELIKGDMDDVFLNVTGRSFM